MARDETMQQRLMSWAEAMAVGDGSGYPVMSVIHPHWTPPSSGAMPTLKTGSNWHVRETHRAIGKLPDRLIATLVVHYVLRQSMRNQALMLCCTVDTIHARVERAHQLLSDILDGTCKVIASSTTSGIVRQAR